MWSGAECGSPVKSCRSGTPSRPPMLARKSSRENVMPCSKFRQSAHAVARATSPTGARATSPGGMRMRERSPCRTPCRKDVSRTPRSGLKMKREDVNNLFRDAYVCITPEGIKVKPAARVQEMARKTGESPTPLSELLSSNLPAPVPSKSRCTEDANGDYISAPRREKVPAMRSLAEARAAQKEQLCAERRSALFSDSVVAKLPHLAENIVWMPPSFAY